MSARVAEGKSYELLNEDRFPGEIGIEQLGEAVAHLASRNHLLRDDLGPGANEADGLRRLLEENPIAAWVGGSPSPVI